MATVEKLISLLSNVSTAQDTSELQSIATLLVKLINNNVSKEEATELIAADKKLLKAILSLKGATVHTDEALISFGQNGQFGDIQIRDIIKGNQININIHPLLEAKEIINEVRQRVKEREVGPRKLRDEIEGLLANNEYVQALAYIREYLRIQSGNTEVWQIQHDVYVQYITFLLYSKKPHDAYLCLKRFEQLNPLLSNATKRDLILKVYKMSTMEAGDHFELGNTIKALELINATISSQPQNIPARIFRAYLYLSQEEYDKAIADAERFRFIQLHNFPDFSMEELHLFERNSDIIIKTAKEGNIKAGLASLSIQNKCNTVIIWVIILLLTMSCSSAYQILYSILSMR